MEFSNAKEFGKLKKRNVLFNIFFFALILSFFFIESIEKHKIYFIVTTSIIYISLLVYFIFLKFTYLNFKDTGAKLIFKYYSLFPIGRKYMSFGIKKTDFLSIEIKSEFFNKRSDLYVYARVKNKKASYPPISLSALKKADKERLIRYLKKLKK